ncbi:BBSome complex assembly protein BBS10 [Genypterus blacodes]|uniref:BBSome complex assembly protein BBS10 n=1 Tax=Genypterus blacodes TaxID=154954 RepID=UPI003F772ECC
MPHVERLHLRHVLQTVCALEEVVLRVFGPEGGQVLFTRDTGQAVLSRSGTQILTALRLEHPLARMVVECVWKHCRKTGDGSKTFILLLASLLRLIVTAAYKERNVEHTSNSREAAEARRLADSLLTFGLEELDDVIAAGVVPYGCSLSWMDITADTNISAHTNTNTHHIQKLLASFFLTRVGCSHCDLISRLTRELLSHWRVKDSPPSLTLHFIEDNFPALHTAVSGFPVTSSRLIEGQIIHRDFATPCPPSDQQPVKAVVLAGYLQPNVLSEGFVLELGGGEKKERSSVQYGSWAETSLQCVFAHLKRLGVSVLLSAVKQSDAALSLAAQAQMRVVECVGKDELSLFAQLSGATPVSDRRLIHPENVATLTFCRPILLGDHRYVHVAFHEPEERLAVKPYSLILCGPGEGQTEQYSRAFRDAVHMLLVTWEPVSDRTSHSQQSTSLPEHPPTEPPPSPPKCVLEPGCVIPAGGTFEFLVHRALLQRDSRASHTDVGVRLLADALLRVPQLLYPHNPRLFLQTQTQVASSVRNHLHPSGLLACTPKDEASPEQTRGKSDGHCHKRADAAPPASALDPGLESVSCKSRLVLSVLQCLSRLLQFDLVLRTRTLTHTRPRCHSNTSQEDREEETDD